MMRIFILAYLATWLAIPHLLWLRKRPVSTLAWIWGIILFPFLGVLVYAVFGTDRMKRKRLKRRAAFRSGEFISGSLSDPVSLDGFSREDQFLLRILERLSQSPLSKAESVKLLVNATTFYPELKEAIRQAKHHVHIQFYIWRNDEVGHEFLDCLVEAAQRGVEVRVLLDELGCFELRASYFRRLVDAGGKFSWFLTLNPRHNRYLLNLRNHRKLQIIDGETAFIGGMNMGREYLGRDTSLGSWRDVQVKLTGPIVNALQESFADDWYFATREKLTGNQYLTFQTGGSENVQILTGGPDSSEEPMQKSILSLLERASKRIWMSTGYFAPNELLLNALQICAARGVEVRLLVARKSDHSFLLQVGRSYYEDLLHFGVRIFEYSQGLNHSKVGLIDDDWFFVGSANLDNRSMRINFELSVLIQSEPSFRELDQLLQDDFNQSTEIHLNQFKRRSTGQKIVESLLRPLAPLL